MIGSRGVEVRVFAWGSSAAQVERAVRLARLGEGRYGWRFAGVERLSDDSCPIDVMDPKAIEAERGEDWAYAVYRHRGVDG